LARNVKTAQAAPHTIDIEESSDLHTFKVGDSVERREWIGLTKGLVVEVRCDESAVSVEWRVGFRLAGTTTTERTADLRKLL
jgi:hypothetical protein